MNEPLPVGMTFKSRDRTITEGEFALMQCLTWQTPALHTSREYMKTTEYGERIMSGSIIFCIALGLQGTTDERAKYQSCGFREGGQLAVRYIRYSAPVHPGDSVWAEVTLQDARPSTKNPYKWIIRRQVKLFKRPDLLCLDSVRYSLLVKDV